MPQVGLQQQLNAQNWYLSKSWYILAPIELELTIWTIVIILGPLQSLKFSSSKSLWKISYTACNMH